MGENAQSAMSKMVLNETSTLLIRKRDIVRQSEKSTERARSLKDVPLKERRKQAGKPLYLLRYEWNLTCNFSSFFIISTYSCMLTAPPTHPQYSFGFSRLTLGMDIQLTINPNYLFLTFNSCSAMTFPQNRRLTIFEGFLLVFLVLSILPLIYLTSTSQQICPSQIRPSEQCLLS